MGPRHSLSTENQTMNIENLTAEEICQGISIQPNLTELQSKDREKVKRTLGTLAAITKIGRRKDSLYALAGYYVLEVHTIEEIEFFFNAIRPLVSTELGYLILKDLTRKKEASRHRTLMGDFFNYVGQISRDAASGTRERMIELVDSAQWGGKMKDKFLILLYSRGKDSLLFME